MSIKELIQWWSPLVVNNLWVLAALGVGLGLLVVVAIFRSIVYIAHYGFRNYLKSSFRIEGETWRVIGILLLVAIAMMLMYARGGG
jgi:hypothetical protein